MKRRIYEFFALVTALLMYGTVFASEGGSGYQIDAMQVIRSSWVIVLMFFLSIWIVGITIERFIYYRKNKLDSEKFMNKVKGLIVDKKFEEAESFVKTQPGPVARVIAEGMESRALPREELAKLMEAKQMEEKVNLERYLGILGTLGNTSPFIGLLGTVLGIIKAFRDLAGSAGGGPEVVMVGIAEALIATAAGLGVAIPAVIIFNYYTKKVKNIAVEMDAQTRKFLVILANYAEGGYAGRRK